MFQIYIGVAILILLGLYFFLRAKWKTPTAGGGSAPVASQTTPPAPSEDVNLPTSAAGQDQSSQPPQA